MSVFHREYSGFETCSYDFAPNNSDPTGLSLIPVLPRECRLERSRDPIERVIGNVEESVATQKAVDHSRIGNMLDRDTGVPEFSGVALGFVS